MNNIITMDRETNTININGETMDIAKLPHISNIQVNIPAKISYIVNGTLLNSNGMQQLSGEVDEQTFNDCRAAKKDTSGKSGFVGTMERIVNPPQVATITLTELELAALLTKTTSIETGKAKAESDGTRTRRNKETIASELQLAKLEGRLVIKKTKKNTDAWYIKDADGERILTPSEVKVLNSLETVEQLVSESDT